MARPEAGDAPVRYDTTVILRDGSTLYLRPIRRDDEDRLLAFFYRLSRHTVYLRFHHVLAHLSQEEARRFCTVDYDDTFALVGIVRQDREERIVAVGRYARLPKRDTAEVAFVVEDSYQGRGIGTLLLERLAAIAREKGIRLFDNEVLAENQQMLKMLKDSGFRIAEQLEQGVYRLIMPIAPTEAAEERSAEREKVAAIASLRSFLQPRSIAVVGASRTPGTIGNRLFRNILHQEFAGILYAVNPNADVVASVKAYPSVLEIPGPVDLAVVVVPANAVQGVLEQCGRKGIRGVVVISAGFGESSPAGLEAQSQLLETSRGFGMRLIGPNCMGIINTSPDVNMNATFSLAFPPQGTIAFGSQSGALGLAILEYARDLNIGLSTFVSLGNRADVSSNDLLQYWQEDPTTSVILLYLESFGNPRKFARIARNVSGLKPIVAVKSGRTPAGSRAAASHTGALASADVASEALFAQAGIIRVDTLEQLFDVSSLLCHQPLPQGRRVAILTNGGGPAILTADACAASGLTLPSLSDATVSQLQPALPGNASLLNPIDMTAEATANQYRFALDVLAHDTAVDIVVVIFIPPIVTEPEQVAAAIRKAAPLFRSHGKTLLASFLATRDSSTQLGSDKEGYVPCFKFPESTAVALSKACDYSDWLKRPRGVVPEPAGIDRAAALSIVESALQKGDSRPVWLGSDAAYALLRHYGIPVAAFRTARTPTEAGKAAADIGFPVAVKLLSDSIVHKTEVGGVILDLRSQREVERAFGRIKKQLRAVARLDEMQGVGLQRMVAGGVELIVGVTQDPSFGPLILCGSGGIYAELYRDVAFRIHPLTDVDAGDMLRSIKAHQLLTGWRGSPPSDIASVEDLLVRVSTMVEDLPQIAELDLNPVKVLDRGSGCIVVDARVLLS